MSSSERRDSNRLAYRRPCKIWDRRAERFHAAWTCNVSERGALIEAARPLPLSVGDELLLGIAARAGQGMIHTHEMITATVVRRLTNADQHTILALDFAQAATTSQTGLAQAA